MNPNYTKYHPKWFRARIPIFWWVHKRQHIRFITRELTSLFVAAYVIILLFLIRALAHGSDAYLAFMERLKSPVAILFHAVAFLFVIFHSITWFNLAPKAMVVHFAGKRIPPIVIALSNYAAWIVVTLFIAWILLK